MAERENYLDEDAGSVSLLTN